MTAMEHPTSSLLGVAALIAIAVVTAAVSRVRLLPEVIDVTFILTAGGFGTLLGAAYGSLRGYDAQGIARASLKGSLGLAGLASLVLGTIFIGQVLS